MNLMKKNLLFLCYYNELKNSVETSFVMNNLFYRSFICPHFGGEIFYKKSEKACNWHNWKFCSSTGKCLSFPIKFGLNPYAFFR